MTTDFAAVPSEGALPKKVDSPDPMLDDALTALCKEHIWELPKKFRAALLGLIQEREAQVREEIAAWLERCATGWRNAPAEGEDAAVNILLAHELEDQAKAIRKGETKP